MVGFEPEVVEPAKVTKVPAAPGDAFGADCRTMESAEKPSTSTIMIQAVQPVETLEIEGPGTAVAPFVLKVVTPSA